MLKLIHVILGQSKRAKITSKHKKTHSMHQNGENYKDSLKRVQEQRDAMFRLNQVDRYIIIKIIWWYSANRKTFDVVKNERKAHVMAELSDKYACKKEPGIQKIEFKVGQPDENGFVKMPKEWWKLRRNLIYHLIIYF